jgi:RimJ/RimL family protein N-acetyltransferase
MQDLKNTPIKIRPLTVEDMKSLVALANNKNISDNLRDGFPHPYTKEDARKFILKNMEADPVTIFAIDYKGNHAGNIGLHLQSDVYRKSAELGYFVGEPFWNKGIATAAISLIVDYGFEKLGLKRIFASAYDYNIVSQRVLEKAGFSFEGIGRKAVFKLGKFLDEYRYAIINEE